MEENNTHKRYLILVVDDEIRISRMIRMNLEHDGYDVIEANTGQQALEALEREEVQLSRVKAVLRRSEGSASGAGGGDDVIQVDDRLRIDFGKREVWVEGELVKLRPTEYRLLYHLVQNAGWVLTYDQILTKVWGYEYRDETHYVRLYINYLRQKLEKDPSNPVYILTERGVGYRFVDYKRRTLLTDISLMIYRFLSDRSQVKI